MELGNVSCNCFIGHHQEWLDDGFKDLKRHILQALFALPVRISFLFVLSRSGFLSAMASWVSMLSYDLA